MRHGRKRLMILGAGHEQLPAILTARALGHFLITVDNLPQNVGHRYADVSLNVSTVEKEEVLAAATGVGIDGITTFASDVAVPSVAHVADRLALRGCGVASAEVMCNKGEFRRMQHAAGLNSPRFAAGTTFGAISKDLRVLGDRLVFKPVDASGSRGVGSVEGADFHEWKGAFAAAKQYSRSGGVCVESYIDGADISGNGFLSQGRLVFAVFTKKAVSAFVVRGHFLPAAFTEAEHTRIVREIEANCAAVGYQDGPLDVDVKLSPRGGATVVEMSPRLGGNGIPELIGRATRTDLTKMAIDFALGDAVPVPSSWKTETCCGSYIFGSPESGAIHRIACETDILASLPEVFACSIRFRKGDRVSAFEHGGNSIGRVSFCCQDESHYESVVARFLEVLGLEVTPCQPGIPRW